MRTKESVFATRVTSATTVPIAVDGGGRDQIGSIRPGRKRSRATLRGKDVAKRDVDFPEPGALVAAPGTGECANTARPLRGCGPAGVTRGQGKVAILRVV